MDFLVLKNVHPYNAKTNNATTCPTITMTHLPNKKVRACKNWSCDTRIDVAYFQRAVFKMT